MTRQEQIKQQAKLLCNTVSPEEYFIMGAEWADAHPVVKVGGALKNYERGYEDAIDKACEWLYEYNRKQVDNMFGTVHTADVTINVAEFRKAMESSCSEFPNNSMEGGEQ